MYEVEVPARELSPFVQLVGAPTVERIVKRAEAMQRRLGPITIWNVNSTASGGGVAEMLRSQLRYVRGLGVDTRWVVLEGPHEFFVVTKRLHNALHDEPGDASPLGAEQRALYERVTADNASRLLELFARRGDIVICHDPQTAGLVPHLVRRGLRVVWRCHIGHDSRGPEVDAGWGFLRSYLDEAPLAVFSRESYAPSWFPRKRTVVLPPNIDPLSLKNEWMPQATVLAVLAASGLVDTPPNRERAVFVREDGTPARVLCQAKVLRASARPPRADVPLIVQVSRWDRMKDHVGVLQAFARLVTDAPSLRAELVLAGPAIGAVADDPESPLVFEEIERQWRSLPEAVQRRAHIAKLPMDDIEENAVIVNALQRHAAIVVQKSLEEGFGLTVTEAMWKRRPVVASAVGGIQDQIRDGIDGLLVFDPDDPRETAGALRRLLDDPDEAHRLGESAHQRVVENYLSITSINRWGETVDLLLEAEQEPRPVPVEAPASA